MKKIVLTLLILCFCSTSCWAVNTGKEINNKCRTNLKLLNAGTIKSLKDNERILPKWQAYKFAKQTFLEPEKYLDGQDIVGPTSDCEYYIVSRGRNDFQWYCNLHGVLEGNRTFSFQYHEHLIMGKINDKYSDIEEYKKHMQFLINWMSYTPTPIEFFKYHYNMNPIVTTILSVVFVVLSWVAIKTLFHL